MPKGSSTLVALWGYAQVGAVLGVMVVRDGSDAPEGSSAVSAGLHVVRLPCSLWSYVPRGAVQWGHPSDAAPNMEDRSCSSP